MRESFIRCVVAVSATWTATSLLAQEPSLPGSPQEVAQFVSTSADKIALVDVTVIDGTGAPARQHQTVLIVGGRIAAVGPTRHITLPEGTVRKALTGRTVMPGLVMLHEHMMYFSGFRTWHSQPVSYPRLYLAAGVTTVRTAGSDFPQLDLNLKRGIDDGRIAGPHMFVTGPFLNGWRGHFLGDDIVETEGEARREVNYWAEHGATSFKLYADLAAEPAAAVIDEAHKRGLKVTAHLGRVTCRQAADLGIDNIEHSFLACLPELGVTTSPDGKPIGAVDAGKAESLIEYLVRRKVVLTSTPTSIETPIGPEERALLHPTALANYDEAFKGGMSSAGSQALVRALERQFLAAGGTMVVGSDPQDLGMIAGYADHKALELLVAAGNSTANVIRMATLGGAQFLGINRDRGSISVGKAADLILVRGDPSRSIADIERVEEVFKDGRGYDPAKLRASAKGMVGWR